MVAPGTSQRDAVMSEVILDTWDGPTVPVHALSEGGCAAALEADAFAGALAKTAEFKGKAGQILLIHGAGGALVRVLLGAGEGTAAFRALAAKLPPGVYRIAERPDDVSAEGAALAFALGSYRFDRYKPAKGEKARLLAEGSDVAEVRQVAHACALARDMVNTPANDMGPRLALLLLVAVEAIGPERPGKRGARRWLFEGIVASGQFRRQSAEHGP